MATWRPALDPVLELVRSRPGFDAMEPACLEAAVPILDGIWMSTGTSNSYAVATAEGRVVVNTGMGFEALLHKRLFDAACPGPTTHVVLTQGHVDHVGGVSHFREAGTVVVAQRNNAACQADDERIRGIRTAQATIWFRRTFERAMEVAREHPEVFVQDRPVPDVAFDDSHAFESGGERFECLAVPGGETIDSCLVWLPARRVVFSGNMLGPLFPHFPNINTIRGDKLRFLPAYLDSLDRLRSLDAEVLVTGHFDPIHGRDLIRACLDRLEGAARHVLDATLEGMNAGRDIFDLMREVTLPAHLEVGQGYGKVSWAVRSIWEGSMGWFKARSTSELYPTRHRDVAPDLVALASAAAVVARGRERLANGDPEGALLLAETVLDADGRDGAALALALDCHRALLERSGGTNFWETGWLRARIRALEKAVAGQGR